MQVHMEPSWPVFIGLQHIKSFRATNLAKDNSVRAHTQSSFSPDHALKLPLCLLSLADGVSRRTTCGCCICNSAVSSMVTTRRLHRGQSYGIRAFSMVVFPEPVPPEIKDMLRAASPRNFKNSGHFMRH